MLRFCTWSWNRSTAIYLNMWELKSLRHKFSPQLPSHKLSQLGVQVLNQVNREKHSASTHGLWVYEWHMTTQSTENWHRLGSSVKVNTLDVEDLYAYHIYIYICTYTDLGWCVNPMAPLAIHWARPWKVQVSSIHQTCMIFLKINLG